GLAQDLQHRSAPLVVRRDSPRTCGSILATARIQVADRDVRVFAIRVNATLTRPAHDATLTRLFSEEHRICGHLLLVRRHWGSPPCLHWPATPAPRSRR